MRQNASPVSEAVMVKKKVLNEQRSKWISIFAFEVGYISLQKIDHSNESGK